MDGSRFDQLTKTLAQGTSRRRVLQGLAGAIAGALAGGRLADSQAACPAGSVPAAGGRCICKNSGRPPVNGSCTSGGGPGGCGAGQTLCGATCVDASSDPANCGACGRPCAPTNNATGVACLAGQCWVASCAPGFADCNATGFDGCETQLGTNQNCGACGDACTGRTTCGGGGTPGVCGCTPGTCESLALNCGTHDDGCGGTLDCTACPTGQTCSGGVCKSNNGDGCYVSAECASGFCVGGICCDRACDGECRSCSTGTCQDLSGACGPAGTCGGTCQAGECALSPIDTSCGSATCSTPSQAKSFSCDGQGHCIEITQNCGLNICRDGACLTFCQISNDCVGEAYCDNGTCREDRASGQTCAEGPQCLSGHCVGGICCQQACSAPDGGTPTCSPDGQTCGFTCPGGSSCGDGCCPDGRTCCTSLDGQSHTCCRPDGECVNGACTNTCLAFAQSCEFSDDPCCPEDGTRCFLDSTANQTCCRDVGGACYSSDPGHIEGGSGCCFQTYPGTQHPLHVGCATATGEVTGPGICGGKGAWCGDGAACASGVCCGTFPALCCGEGEACAADGTCKRTSGPCTGPNDCASGLCCGGQCTERTNEHCASCTHHCPPDLICADAQCKRAAGASCTTAVECVDGYCYDGICCDECGGLCGKPRSDRTRCDVNAPGIARYCCQGQCTLLVDHPGGDPYHCGCAGNEICPVGDNCSDDGQHCSCSTPATCLPGQDTMAANRCDSPVTSTCSVDVHGERFCAWARPFFDGSITIPCDANFCDSNDDCPPVEECRGLFCSSTWRCAAVNSTCCSDQNGNRRSICVLVAPEGRDT